GDVEAASLVEVEHVRLVDHRLVVEPGAALHAPHGDAPEDALLHGEDQTVVDAFLPGDRPDALADAEAQVADVTGTELEEGAPSDRLADVQRKRGAARRRTPHRSGVVGRK